MLNKKYFFILFHPVNHVIIDKKRVFFSKEQKK